MAEDDLVKRLRELVPAGRDFRTTEIHDAIHAAAAEIERCHARLAIDHFWQLDGEGRIKVPLPYKDRATFPDGIECRDETIKIQDENTAALRLRATSAEATLRAIREFVTDCDPSAPNYNRQRILGMLDDYATLATPKEPTR